MASPQGRPSPRPVLIYNLQLDPNTGRYPIQEPIDLDDPRGELRLLASLLVRAVSDYYGLGGVERHIRREATKWLFNWKPFHHKIPFTFPWICDHLNACPNTIKKNLLSKTIKPPYRAQLSTGAVPEWLIDQLTQVDLEVNPFPRRRCYRY